jgi:transcriptional regulator with XRE-family HTH domain
LCVITYFLNIIAYGDILCYNYITLKGVVKMKELNMIIGENLKDVRKKQNLSLDETSELTGVSKAMLGQIERGQSNPTVSTLWKIATGLKVPFSEFMKKSQTDYEVVSLKNIDPILECGENMKIYTMFPFNSEDDFEILYIKLKSNSIHKSKKHRDEVKEYVFVIDGILEMKIGSETVILKRGEALKFNANIDHEYSNFSDKECLFQNLIVYHKKN